MAINEADAKLLKSIEAVQSKQDEEENKIMHEAILEADKFKNKTSKVRGLNMDDEVKLPIVFHEREIMENILNNVVTIVCGETGSGKSTQIPQFIYKAAQ